MIKNVLAWTCTILAVFALGPIATVPLTWLRAVDGSRDVTLLVNRAPLMGVGMLLGVMAVALAVGVVVGRIVNRPTGMASAWLIGAWGAWRLSTVDKVFAAAANPQVMWLLAVEGLLVALGGLVLTVVLRDGADGAKESDGVGQVKGAMKGLAEPAVWAGVAAGVVVGGIVTHLVAYQALKGQAFAAAAIGSVGAAAASHLTMLLMGKQPSPVVGAMSVVLLAAAGPIAAQVMYGSGLAQVLRAGPGLTGGGGVIGIAVPVSLDWLGGMLLGLPIGEGWATSMVDKRMQPARKLA